jgi:hypothetical protein
MKGKLLISAILVVALMGVASLDVFGAEDTTINLTIDPGETGGEALPHFDGDTIDVVMTSDIPVNVYVISYENAMNNLTYGEELVYEEKWESKTSLDVNYQVDDPDELYYLMVENPSETETANVELEYKLYTELFEEAAEDAAEEACSGTLILGIVGLTILVAAAVFVRKR